VITIAGGNSFGNAKSKPMRDFLRYLLMLLLSLSVTACHRQLTVTKTTPVQPVNTVSPVLMPTDNSTVFYHGLRYPAEVMNFYVQRKGQPFWTDATGKTARADSALSIVGNARRLGLLPQHYHVEELSDLRNGNGEKTNVIRLEAVLTDAFFSMANDLKHGRVQKRAIATLDTIQAHLLADTLTPRGIRQLLSLQEPSYQQYKLLKGALNTLLDTVNLADRELLMMGQTNDSLQSHTIVQRIEVNLERWRTENAGLVNTHVWINIPAYMFYVVEDEKVVMESRVIVGAPKTPTPVFSSNIECFTVFPYWYMPRKIAVQEYLPVIKKDTSFISRNNFDVLDRNGKIQDPATIDWKQYNANNFPFKLRQREGKENSLGIVKFVFDNPYAVYVHDTNAKSLFRNKTRAYSHGCIRLEKAVDFSYYLIGGKRSTTSSEALAKYLDGQKRITISLLETVPIHIRYFTAEVRDGKLLFYPDIYKKDAGFVNALHRKDLF
jgi:murein L,D-transpeptidase YcbB/YkuD